MSAPVFYCNKSLKAKRPSVYKGPVHTNLDTFETAYFFFYETSEPHILKPLYGVDFFGSDGFGYFVWTTENGYFWCQLRHECECSLKWKLSNSKWWTLQWLYSVLFATLLALIAILIACVVLIWRQQLAISKDRRLNLILIMKSLSSRRRSEPCQSRF